MFIINKLTSFVSLNIILQIIYWVIALFNYKYPGFYFDAVLPEHTAIQYLNNINDNPTWTFPSMIPLLAGPYSGNLPFFTSIVIFYLFGANEFTLRIAQYFLGSILVLIFSFILKEITKKKWICFLGTLLIIVEPTFIMSFRTEAGLNLVGAIFLLLAFKYLFFIKNKKDIFIIGLLLGLSFYGYFNYLFFFFIFLFFLFIYSPIKKMLLLKFYFFGFFIGSIGYLIGYLSSISFLGGIDNFINYFTVQFTSVDPFRADETYYESLILSINKFFSSVLNHGNESMVFSKVYSDDFKEIKRYFFSLSIFLPLIFWLFHKKRFSHHSIMVNPIILPVSIIMFIIFQSILGSRLHSHHFILLLPVIYLTFIIFINDFFNFLNLRFVQFKKINSFWPYLITVPILVSILFVSFIQVKKYNDVLNETGGLYKFSSSLNNFAKDARIEINDNPFYIFPEWGFFTTFKILTENKIMYSIYEVTPELIRKNKLESRKIRIAYWDHNKIIETQDMLLREFDINTFITTYYSKNGVKTFYVLKN